MSKKETKNAKVEKNAKATKKEQPAPAATAAVNTPATKDAIKERKAAIQAELKKWKEKETQLSKKAPLIPSWKKMRNLVLEHPELRGNMDSTIRAAVMTITDTAVVTLCIQYRKYRDRINAPASAK